MEEDEIPLGTFPDTQEAPEPPTEAERLEAAWEAVPPGLPNWIPPGGEIWTPPAGEETTIRRLTGYMTERYEADVPPAWGADYRVLTVGEPERNCSITIDGYVRQEKYDELVNDFNNLKAKVDRLEAFLSTVSSPDDEMMTI